MSDSVSFSSNTFTGETKRSKIDRTRQIWLERLQNTWSRPGDCRIMMIGDEIQEGTDLLSSVLHADKQGALIEWNSLTRLIERVQSPDFSITDLFVEMTELKAALSSGLNGSQDSMDRLFRLLDDAFGKVLKETAETYEAAMEAGIGGFCRIDDDGRIVFANNEMARLLGIEDVRGLRLTDIVGEGLGHLSSAMTGLPGPPDAMRSATLRRGDGSEISVKASIGRLRHSERTSAYGLFSTISQFTGAELQIFDRMPVGILQTSSEGEVLYANKALCDLIKMTPQQVIGQSLFNLIGDAKAHEEIRGNLSRMNSLISERHDLEFTRLADGCRLKVRVSAVPIRDVGGGLSSVVSIIKNLEEEVAAAAIIKKIEESSQAEVLLAGAAEILQPMVPFDMFMVSVFSPAQPDGRQDCRVMVEVGRDPAHADQRQTRWYSISPALSRMLAAQETRVVPDYEAFMDSPELVELRGTEDANWFRDAGFKSLMIHTIRGKNGVAASVTWASKSFSFYTEEHAGKINRLPLAHAVGTAIGMWHRRNETFRTSILLKAAEADTLHRLAAILVKELAMHYGWNNISVFQVDEARRRLILKEQSAGSRGYLLPVGYEQDIETGLLGLAYRRSLNGQPATVCVGNVLGDVPEAKHYVASNVLTRSELCIPIQIGGSVRWILNIEDAQKNAFTLSDQSDLTRLFKSIRIFLQHLFTYYMLDEVFKNSSDLIITTDTRGILIDVNKAAEDFLGVRQSEVKNMPFADFFLRRQDAATMRPMGRLQPTPVTLLKSSDRKPVKVLLSARELPPEFDRIVYRGRDWEEAQRQLDLTVIEKVLHDIASQTHAPLALVDRVLRRMMSTNPKCRNDADDALRHLRRLELSFDRLMGLYDEQALPSRIQDKLRLRSLVDRVVSDLPDYESDLVRVAKGPTDPMIRGDEAQIAFAVESLLAHLLRYLPEDETVTVCVDERDERARVEIGGMLPPDEAERIPEGIDGLRLARLRNDLAMGIKTIERFMERHCGSFEMEKRPNGRTSFVLSFPKFDRKRNRT
jgi:PAS domain S-box-containing protein